MHALLLALLGTAVADDVPAAPTAVGQVAVGQVAVGQVWSVPPAHAPQPFVAPDALSGIASYLATGEAIAALRTAEHVAAHGRSRRDRAAAWMVVGMLHREAGRPNLASEAFTQVRIAGEPLAPLGAWFEAEQDHARGRYAVAVAECDAYLENWPEGPHAEPCQQLRAFGLVSSGNLSAGLQAAADWDEANERSPIYEQVSLAAAAWERANKPEAAAKRYRRLATHFRAPLTHQIAARTLAELAAEGVAGAEVPMDLESRKARAVSFKESRAKEDAWRAFLELASEADDDPSLQRWVDANATSFGWKVHQWDALAEIYRASLKSKPNPDTAWSLYRVLDRGGRYEEAVDVAQQAMSEWASHRRWRWSGETISRSMLLAQDYKTARNLLAELAEEGGSSTTNHKYYAAFAAMQGGLSDARARFDELIAEGKGLEDGARYWRAELAAASDPDQAAIDRSWILEHTPDSWYAVLLRGEAAHEPGTGIYVRAGRWPGPPPGPAPTVTALASAELVASPLGTQALTSGAPGFARMTWPWADAAPAPVPSLDDVVQPSLWTPANKLPVLPESPLHDRAASARAFANFTVAHAERWPILPAVHDLAHAGLHDLSGPLFARFYDEWARALRARDPDARAVDADLGKSDWRRLFLFAADHHNTTSFSYGQWKYVDPEDYDAVRALDLPPAHARMVFRHGQAHDVDPYLVLGVMRTESIYDANAVSRVGARGPMQIMPRTGHLLAERVQDEGFTTGQLYDPAVAIGYGVTYLGMLLDRFDGVFPLAVASYNGGPHNVSTWMGALPGKGLDVVVEHIPYGETRRYTRSVTARYARYVALYEPGQQVVVPAKPLGDHRDIVDF